jgi:hypothetical protein
MEREPARTIVINGREYESADEMPPEIREVYERALALTADADGNGVPDVLEGKGRGLLATLREAWGVAQAAKKAGIQSFELPRSSGASPTPMGVAAPRANTPQARRPVEPPATRPPSSLEPTPVGGRLGTLLILGCFAGAAWLLARELGLF